MPRRIIIDGIRIEGAEAKRIVNEVLLDADETGTPRHRLPVGLLLSVPGVIGVFIESVIGILGDVGRRRALVIYEDLPELDTYLWKLDNETSS